MSTTYILSLYSASISRSTSLWTLLLAATIIYVVATVIYRTVLHPLKRVPGPFIARTTSLWLAYHGFVGDECRIIRRLHEQYGPVVRTSPNDVDIADGEALWKIYMDKGGFDKPDYYNTFDLNGHASIFSSQRLSHRESRVKAVLPLFSLKSVRSAKSLIEECANKFVARLQSVKKDGKPVNIIGHTRAFALDAVTGYVFGKTYGALDEPLTSSSAGLCVDMFISDSMFYYFPPWLTSVIQRLAPYVQSKERFDSEACVDKYLLDISTKPPPDRFSARLVERSFCEAEIFCQVKDALFAGTDSTGNSLAHFCYYLAKYPDTHARLRKDVLAALAESDADPLSIPYLQACIKEALRLTHSISIRLPRVVPATGFTIHSYHLPVGTVVGIAAYQLHLDPTVFPSPFDFRPERWTDGPVTEAMTRDWLPFGKGARSCIARNLAQSEMALVATAMVKADVLRGATVAQAEIEKYEWFFSRIKGDRIELVWE